MRSFSTSPANIMKKLCFILGSYYKLEGFLDISGGTGLIGVHDRDSSASEHRISGPTQVISE